ncbi:hypothetical protein, partial [Pseudorhizobium pelagicum]|uniref:hypothetical protein n=1 Tax=Pseudorhizobium pelagicum TaxID=1509405 RepID=UPI002989E6D9
THAENDEDVDRKLCDRQVNCHGRTSNTMGRPGRGGVAMRMDHSASASGNLLQATRKDRCNHGFVMRPTSGLSQRANPDYTGIFPFL